MEHTFHSLEHTFHSLERMFHQLECTFHQLEHNILSFPDFSRRFFASLAEKIYTFSLAILLRFTVSLIPCCEC